MRDITLVIMLLTLAWMAWRQPWVGVLGLVIISTLHPQAYAGEWMRTFPLYKALFLITSAAMAADAWREHSLPRLVWDWRLPVLGLLFLDFIITTYYALLPDTAMQTLLQVGTLLPTLLLIVLLIDSREKFHALIVTCSAAIALIALKGGYWAVMTGFQDRVYGPPSSQIGGNNEFAVALVMTIPLLVLWLRWAKDRSLRIVIMAAIALCYVAALTSWSRGGLVSLAVMTALLIWHSQRKWLAIPLLALGIILAFVSLPETWFGRMQTISTYDQDQSFQGREEVWRKGLAYLRIDPWTGSGFEGWRSISAEFHGDGAPGNRDWHSAYVEMAVEHGLPGFLLWGALLFGSLLNLSWLIHRGRSLNERWLADSGAMLRAALLAYAVGGLTLGISYWELFYLWLAMAMVASRLAQCMTSSVRHEMSKNFTNVTGKNR